jgi:hypothetical protein
MSSLIEALGLNPFQFSQGLGVSSTQIYNCLNGRNAPSFDLLSKIAITYPTVNIVWLLTGKGMILINGNEEVKENVNMMERIKTLEEMVNKLSSNRPKMSEQEALEVLSQAMKKKSKG